MFSETVDALPPRAHPGRPRRTRAAGSRTSVAAPHVSRALAVLLAASSDEADTIETLARVRTLTVGQSVFARQDKARAAVLLAHGSVALGLDRGAGGVEVERIAHAPAWLDLASV